MKIFALFFITALCEILGCYFPWLALKMNKTLWYLLPGYLFLTLFAWLLTFHSVAEIDFKIKEKMLSSSSENNKKMSFSNRL